MEGQTSLVTYLLLGRQGVGENLLRLHVRLDCSGTEQMNFSVLIHGCVPVGSTDLDSANCRNDSWVKRNSVKK